MRNLIKGKSFFTRVNDKKGMDFRIFLYKDRDFIHKTSFWHDINPFNQDGSYNIVVEIPKGENAKLEMSKETYNPIKQDIKKNKITNEEYLRFYKMTPNFNYGFIPRTWESNKVKSIDDFIGDNDPLDIVELSENKLMYTGQILKVYIVGSFCLIDQNEVDWKILTVDCGLISFEESLTYLNQEKNIEKVKEIGEWFKTYKTYEGKKQNTIYKNDKIFGIEETKKIIDENHKFYLNLINAI